MFILWWVYYEYLILSWIKWWKIENIPIQDSLKYYQRYILHHFINRDRGLSNFLLSFVGAKQYFRTNNLFNYLRVSQDSSFSNYTDEFWEKMPLHTQILSTSCLTYLTSPSYEILCSGCCAMFSFLLMFMEFFQFLFFQDSVDSATLASLSQVIEYDGNQQTIGFGFRVVSLILPWCG